MVRILANGSGVDEKSIDSIVFALNFLYWFYGANSNKAIDENKIWLAERYEQKIEYLSNELAEITAENPENWVF